VLAAQTSPDGLGAALLGAVLIALAAWAFQKSRLGTGAARAAPLITAAVAVALALMLPWRFAVPAHAARAAAAAGAEDGWHSYDAAELERLRAAGRPVLVNFTASWCLTCLVNERNAFADAAVQEIFHDKRVVLMKGDWTNRDPAITRALAAFGRAGVPLYLVYNGKRGGAEAEVLPQILTAGIVAEAFADAPARTAAR
jgi:thiol:disulfide interchange protein DsbD